MESTSLQVHSSKLFESAKARLERLNKTPLERAVASDKEYQALAAAITEAKAFRKEWDNATKPVRAATKEAHNAACKMFSDIDNPLDTIIRRGAPILINWENRRAAEIKAQEDALNKKIAEEQKAAVALETPEGETPPEPIPALVVTLPKFSGAAGLSRRTMWAAKVTDIKALAKAVGAGKLPVSYILPNMVMLNTQARALKKDFKVPGVEAVEEQTLAERAAR